MNHYTYWIYAGGKHYIGVRSCRCDIYKDEYFGSQRNLLKYINNGGEYEKQILGVFSSRKEAIAHEVLLHNLFDVARSDIFWNLSKQTSTKFDCSGVPKSEEHRMKIGLAQKGKIIPEEVRIKQSKAHLGKKMSEEFKEKQRQLHIGKPSGMSGKKMSEECKKARSLAMLGESNHFFGKKHSEETLQKMRVPKTEEHKMKLRKPKRKKGLL